jgi:hypothetical protein
LRRDGCIDFGAIVEPMAGVDLHDVGSAEMNIFNLTADPGATFKQAKPPYSGVLLLENSELRIAN